MQYGLENTTISAIQGVFAQYAAIECAIVYGSRAKGTFRHGSDIDLTLQAPLLDFSTLMEIENALDDLFLPYKIDTSLLHQISNEHLLAHIQRVGAVFYPQ